MQRLSLRDGRSLAYSWFGAPPPPRQPASQEALTIGKAAGPGAAAPARAAAPISVLLHFHGFLSSRLEAALLDADARHHGMSVLAVDRPGHGGSTLNPQQTVESTAEDVKELLDSLGLHSVFIQGASGGAPYACATAALLGTRAAGLLLVCPLMPAAGREAELLFGVSPSSLRLAHGAQHHPWRVWATLHALRLLQRIPHGNLLLRLGGFSEEDRRVMAERPEAAAALTAAVREGLAQGVRGALQDLQLFYVNPPAVDLSSLALPTHIWQGTLDSTTPPAMACAYARALPKATLHELEEGHISLPFRHNRAILGSLLGS
ncbi:hypothetical protein ABPG75_002097 [Micractinium tetrahymenae]